MADIIPSTTSFRAFLAAMGRSPRTCRTYGDYIDRMLRIRAPDEPVDDRLARRFLQQIADQRSLSSSTYRIVFSALERYLVDWLHQPTCDLGTRPQAAAKGRHDAITVLTRDQLLALLRAFRKPVHRLFAILIYGTGLRLLETCQLRVEDLAFATRRIRIHRQKGGGGRWVGLSQALAGRLEVFVAGRAPGSFVFASPRSSAQHLSPASFQCAFQRARDRAQLPSWVTPHALRHTFATHQLQAGLDIRSLQHLLGHTVITTTMRYVHFLDMDGGAPRQPIYLIAALESHWRDHHGAGAQR